MNNGDDSSGDSGALGMHDDMMEMINNRERQLHTIYDQCVQNDYEAAMSTAIASRDLVVISDFIAAIILQNPKVFITETSLSTFHVPVVNSLLHSTYPYLASRGAALLRVIIGSAEDVFKTLQGPDSKKAKKIWLQALKELDKSITEAEKKCSITMPKEIPGIKKRLNALLASSS